MLVFPLLAKVMVERQAPPLPDRVVERRPVATAPGSDKALLAIEILKQRSRLWTLDSGL